MNLLPSTPPRPNSDERWKFVRDVAVFQLKLLLDNVRDIVLMPVALAAALIDLVFRGEREGARFYKVLRWGAHSEDVIDVYSAIEHHEPGDFKINPAYTVDGVIARLEGVVVREVEKGGTAGQHQDRDGSGDRSAALRNGRRTRQGPECGRPDRG